MSRTDSEMIRFVLQWARYGGGDDYIFVKFGLQPVDFYQRVLSVVESDTSRIDQELRRRLTAFCTHKTAQLSAHASVGQPVLR